VVFTPPSLSCARPARPVLRSHASSLFSTPPPSELGRLLIFCSELRDSSSSSAMIFFFEFFFFLPAMFKQGVFPPFSWFSVSFGAERVTSFVFLPPPSRPGKRLSYIQQLAFFPAVKKFFLPLVSRGQMGLPIFRSVEAPGFHTWAVRATGYTPLPEMTFLPLVPDL